jgi:hypothetical protein
MEKGKMAGSIGASLTRRVEPVANTEEKRMK